MRVSHYLAAVVLAGGALWQPTNAAAQNTPDTTTAAKITPIPKDTLRSGRANKQTLQALSGTDTVALSLMDALGIAISESDEVILARSQIDLARTQVTAARSQALPQINGNVSYTRTLASPFESSGISIPDSLKFEPDSTAPILDRIRYLERNAPTAGLGGLGSLFGDLPFGQQHAYTGVISASQLLYSGGRTGAALKIAARYLEAAELNYTEERAAIELDVQNAYYQAVLAQEMEQIAAAAVQQSQEFLDQERLKFNAGVSSELEVLRAEVALENLRPQLVQASNGRDLATLNLKRLLNIPMNTGVVLTTNLITPAGSIDSLPNASAMASELSNRASLRAIEKQVAIRRQQISIARGAYLPSLNLDFRYGGQMFPNKVFDFSGTDFRKDVSAIVTLQIPIFSGFRRRAEYQQAQVELMRSELQLDQFREGLQLEYEQTRGERARAASSITARQRTVDQAARVYELTVLRYDQGLATQLEATDARLALLQARTNLVQALADFYIADAGVNRALGRSILGGSAKSANSSLPVNGAR